MKKTNLLMLSLCTLSVFPASSCGAYDLVVFNWGEYMDMDRIREFEKLNGVKINYLTYDSNENLLSKLESTYFDIAFPSDYAVEELAVKGLIQEINYDKLDNFDPDTSLVPSLKVSLDELAKPTLGKSGFDLLKYAIPYTWGEIGLLYDTTKISKEELDRDGFGALLNPLNDDGTKRRTVIYDAARDVFSVALVANGLDIVDVSDDDIDVAKNWLVKQKKNLKNNLAYKTEEILDDMPNRKYDLCFTYAGDAIYAMSTVEDDKGEIDYDYFDFYIPKKKDGAPTRTNIYVDAISISSHSKNEDLAYRFLDYLQEYEVAYDNSLYNGYTSPINQIYEDITSSYSEYEEGPGSFFDIKEAYQVKSDPSDKFYRYDPELKSKLEEAWIEVKIS